MHEIAIENRHHYIRKPEQRHTLWLLGDVCTVHVSNSTSPITTTRETSKLACLLWGIEKKSGSHYSLNVDVNGTVHACHHVATAATAPLLPRLHAGLARTIGEEENNNRQWKIQGKLTTEETMYVLSEQEEMRAWTSRSTAMVQGHRWLHPWLLCEVGPVAAPSSPGAREFLSEHSSPLVRHVLLDNVSNKR
jgi:hypothetical protein